MFCKRCGKEIEDSSKFCKYCGGSITEEAILQNSTSNGVDGPPEKEAANENFHIKDNYSENLVFSTKSQLILMRVLQIVALLAFLGPFIRYKIFSISINGFELTIAHSFQDAIDFGSDPLNVFLMFVLLIGIGNLLLTFIEKKSNEMKTVSGNALLAVIGLILFRVTMQYYYQMADYDMAMIKIAWGWWSAVIAYVAIWLMRFIPKRESID